MSTPLPLFFATTAVATTFPRLTPLHITTPITTWKVHSSPKAETFPNIPQSYKTIPLDPTP